MISKIFKGFHFSFPPLIRLVKEIDYRVTFNESCIYDLGDSVEQNDFFKIIGLKKNYFSPRKNSAMLAGRWNIDKDRLELTPYFHNDKGEKYFDETFLYTINREDINSSIRVRIYPENEGMSIIMCDVNSDSEEGHKMWRNIKTSKWSWIINFWFGGTLPASKDISIEFKNNKKEIKWE